MASQTPKSASQRLLTMKFMQRAAAASPASPSTPTSDHEQPPKRRKTSGRASLGAPEKQHYVIDRRAAQAALEEDERKRQVLVAKHAEALGDSHWVLDSGKLPGSQQDSTPLKIVQVGFSQIDRGGVGPEVPEEAAESTAADGPTFRSFGPKKEVSKEKDDDDDSDSDSDSDDSSSDSSGSSGEDSSQGKHKKTGRNSYGSQKRPEIRTRHSAEREKAQRLAKERRKKEVKLNTLTSISGSGSSNFSRPSAPGRRR